MELGLAAVANRLWVGSGGAGSERAAATPGTERSRSALRPLPSTDTPPPVPETRPRPTRPPFLPRREVGSGRLLERERGTGQSLASAQRVRERA